MKALPSPFSGPSSRLPQPCPEFPRRLGGPARAIAAAAVLVGLVPGPAHASDFLVSVGGTAPSSFCGPLVPSPASGSWTFSGLGSGRSSATAAAGGGILGAVAAASASGTSTGFQTAAACYTAQVVIDDMVLSGPGSTATVQVSADLSGLVKLVGLNLLDATADITASLELGQVTPSGTLFPAFTKFAPSTFGSGTNTTITATLTTPPIALSTSSPIAVRLTLYGKVSAADNFAPGSASCLVDLTNGLSFPTSGPVFTLPAGFTVDSADGNIANNRFVPARASEVVRLGSPPNPAALLPGVTSGPVLGRTWDPVVDHTAFVPGATLDILFISPAPLNLVSPFGTLLCLPTSLPSFLVAPPTTFAVPVPYDYALAGATFCTQAASTDGFVLSVTNALDITLGAL